MSARLITAPAIAALLGVLGTSAVASGRRTPLVAGFWTLGAVATRANNDPPLVSTAIQRLACTLAAASGQLTIAPIQSLVTIVDGHGELRVFSATGEAEHFEFGNQVVDVTTSWAGERLVQHYHVAGDDAAVLSVFYEPSGRDGLELRTVLAIDIADGETIVLQRRTYSSDAVPIN